MLRLWRLGGRAAFIATPSTLLSPLAVQRRFQSQSRRGAGGAQYGDEGVVDPRYSSSDHWKRFNPDTAPHYVKATIQNERRELGLSPVVDWKEFAEEAVVLTTTRGQMWVGADDPRCAKLIKRREKMKRKVAQVPRKQSGGDPAKDIQDHPFRQFFVSPLTLTDPMSVSDGMYRAGMIKEYDVKFTAGKISYEARPPIVTIMGHVDHGKTTLLDYLRKTNVAAGEAGGITQTVGAFSVVTPDGSRVTFVDTPGHAAFSNMREVGALITDMIILIVSTVDGVQPQTLEVIKLAQENHLPMVVACSKIDRNPDMEKIKAELRKHNVELEEDGGDVQVVGISSIDGTGIPALLEAVALQAALSEISTPVPCRVEVSVIESKGAGDINEICGIVRCGVLKPGMVLVSGISYAMVKEIYDENHKVILQAPPGTPVMMLGFKVLPKPGNVLMQVSSLSHAEKFYHFMKDVYNVEGKREEFLRVQDEEQRGNLYYRKPDHNNAMATDEHTVQVICKADSFGGLQALLRLIYQLPKIKGVRTVMKITEVGPMRYYDTMLASQGSGNPAVILLFGNVADRSTADPHSSTKILRFDVVYHGIQMYKEALVGFLPPIKKTRVTAVAECQQTFKASQAGRKGNAGGFVVRSGTLIANHLTFRVLRKASKTSPEAEVVYEGQLRELRRFKELVPSVEQGMECGVILFDEFMFRPGDVLEQVEHYEEQHDVEEVYEEARKHEEYMRMRAAAEDQASTEKEAPAPDAKAA
jgi:translation initiation factor IF-2